MQKLEKILRKEVRSYRNNYIYFKTPKTWEFLVDISFSYDSTFRYRLSAGFINGMYLLSDHITLTQEKTLISLN